MKKILLLLLVMVNFSFAYDEDRLEVGLYTAGNNYDSAVIGLHLQYSFHVFDAFENVLIAVSGAYGEGSINNTFTALTEGQIKAEYEFYDGKFLGIGYGLSSKQNIINEMVTISYTYAYTLKPFMIPTYFSIEYRSSTTANKLVEIVGIYVGVVI